MKKQDHWKVGLALGVACVILIVVLGCNNTTPDSHVEATVVVKQTSGYVLRFDKVILEQHEYWVRFGGHAGGLEHSASCPCHE